MKHVQACLSAMEDRQCCFHHCTCPVRLVQAVHARERPHNAVLTSEEVLGSTCKPVLVPEKIEKALLTAVEVL